MSGLSQENIEWAVAASENGSTVEFIASVLGVKQKRAETILRVHSGKPCVEVGGRYAWRATPSDTSLARQRAEALFSKATPESDVESIENDDVPHRGRCHPPEQPVRVDSMYADRRRRFLISVWHARYWDLIWFLTEQGMRRPTLESHFGSCRVAYTRGEGFDWECTA